MGRKLRAKIISDFMSNIRPKPFPEYRPSLKDEKTVKEFMDKFVDYLQKRHTKNNKHIKNHFLYKLYLEDAPTIEKKLKRRKKKVTLEDVLMKDLRPMIQEINKFYRRKLAHKCSSISISFISRPKSH